MRLDSQPAACRSRLFHNIHGPFRAGFWVVLYLVGCKIVEHQVIGRVDRYKLPLEVGRKFGDFQAIGIYFPFKFIAVGLALRGFVEVDKEVFPGGNLYPFVTKP